MFGLFKRSRKSSTPRQSIARPRVEQLEDRLVPAVTFHGGDVIAHPQVDTVYYGTSWGVMPWVYSPAQQTMVGLDQFFRTITHSSYLSMLGEYGVGLGSWDRRDVVAGPGSPGSYGVTSGMVTEDAIRNMLIQEDMNGHLPVASKNEVLAVFLPTGFSSQWDEAHSTGAHHDFLPLPMWQNGAINWYHWENVAYTVVSSPSANTSDRLGYAGPAYAAQSDFQKLTVKASHELSEAVTNPFYTTVNGVPHYGTGWWDDNPTSRTYRDEIGDVAAYDAPVTFDGYAVQREWSNYWGRDVVPAVDSAGAYSDPAGVRWWRSYSYSLAWVSDGNATSPTHHYAARTGQWLDWQVAGGWAGWYEVG